MSISWVDTSRLARHTKVIAVADVVESVRLMEQDEQEFIRRWHGFVGFVQQHLPLETGRMHKSLGDGLMMEFADADGCIRAAQALQGWFEEGNQGLPPERQVHLRIGAHVADYVSDEHDIYGTDVNLTARIATLAGPGEIVISAALRERLRAEPSLDDLGLCHLKHVKQPVRAFRLGRAGRSGAGAAQPTGGWSLRPVIAVLPFARDAQDAAVAEAIADETVATLSGSAELQVVSRLTTAPFRNERATLEELGRHVRAHYVLRGHVRQHGERVAVFGELTDAGTGHVAWAQSFKGTADELLAPECPLVHELAARITAGVISREAERAQGQRLPALADHTLLLAAIALMHRLGPTDLQHAGEMLEHLVERNRRHVAPHAWLAHWHVLRARQGWASVGNASALARESCHAALQADGRSPLALCMDGQVRLHLLSDVESAAARFRQVLAMGPDHGLALLLHAELLALHGEAAQALELAQRALARCLLEPLRHLCDYVLALAAWLAGDARRALFHAERSVGAQPLFLPALATLAAAELAAGLPQQARHTVQRLQQAQPDFSCEAFLARFGAGSPVAQRLAEALQGAGLPTSGPAASSSA